MGKILSQEEMDNLLNAVSIHKDKNIAEKAFFKAIALVAEKNLLKILPEGADEDAVSVDFIEVTSFEEVDPQILYRDCVKVLKKIRVGDMESHLIEIIPMEYIEKVIDKDSLSHLIKSKEENVIKRDDSKEIVMKNDVMSPVFPFKGRVEEASIQRKKKEKAIKRTKPGIRSTAKKKARRRRRQNKIKPNRIKKSKPIKQNQRGA